MNVEDKTMAMSVGKTVLVLVIIMFGLIVLANAVV